MTEVERLSQVIDYLRNNTRYEDGVLYWTTPSTRRIVGGKAGSLHPSGYLKTEFLGKKYSIHRLVFLLHKGYMPTCIDHIDGNKTNNRIENLRECTLSENQANRAIQKTNKFGVKGVHSHKTGGYQATVTFNGVRWSKLFQNFDKAVEAVTQKRLEIHGEFARFK